ncbi:MAG: hypothetical protein ACRDJ4_14955 [Actinomycetota bacterium]
MTVLTEAREPCGCGCECCAEAPPSAEEEIAQLLTLNDAIVRRLAELGVE